MSELKTKNQQPVAARAPFVSAKDYYSKHEWIQKSPQFTSSKEAAAWLSANKQGSNSISYLMECLWHGNKIPEDKLQEFRRSAAAADYFQNNKWLQDSPSFTSPTEAIAWLSANNQDSNSLGYLMVCLWHGNKIPDGKHKSWQFDAGAADYFQNNKWLRDSPSFTSSKEAIAWLSANRQDSNSLSYLVQCLWYSNKIPMDNLQSWQFDAAAADYFQNNKWLQDSPSFTSPKEAIAWLSANNQGSNSIGYLMLCLWYGNKIPEEKHKSWQFDAGAAVYALKKKPVILEELRGVFERVDASLIKSDKSLVATVKRNVDRAKFTYLRDETNLISESYLSTIITFALILYGNEALSRNT